MNNALKRLCQLFALFFFVHVAIITWDGLHDEGAKADVAVILGTKVDPDGSLTARLQGRLDRGLKLYNDSLVKRFYVTGGLGKEGYYEGTVMANYLISKGVPEHLVTVDNEGWNTRSSALNFQRDNSIGTSVVVVSQYFHVTRCKLAFRQVGVINVSGAHAEHYSWRDPYSILREFVGYYKYLVCY